VEAHAGKDGIADGVEGGEVFVGEEAWDAVGVEFGFGQVGFHERVVGAKDNNFFRGRVHGPRGDGERYQIPARGN